MLPTDRLATAKCAFMTYLIDFISPDGPLVYRSTFVGTYCYVPFLVVVLCRGLSFTSQGLWALTICLPGCLGGTVTSRLPGP